MRRIFIIIFILIIPCVLLSSCGELLDALTASSGEESVESAVSVEEVSESSAEEVSTEPKWKMEVVENEVFPDEPSRRAAEQMDPAIARAIEMLNDKWVNDFAEKQTFTAFPYDPDSEPKEYDGLNEDAKELYDVIYDAAVNFGNYEFDEREYPKSFISDFLAAYSAVSHDHPDLFMYTGCVFKGFITSNAYCMPNETVNHVCEDLDAVKDEVEFFYRTIDRVAEKMPEGLTDIQKYIYLVGVVCYTTEYDYSLASDLDDSQAYNALVKRLTVCHGYARAYYLLCTKCGLDCRCVIGNVGEDLHMWNAIKTSEGTRYIDTCWVDTTSHKTSYPYEFYPWYVFMTEEDLVFEGYDLIG